MPDVLIVGTHPYRPSYRAAHEGILSYGLKVSGLSNKSTAYHNLWAKAPINDDISRFFIKRQPLKKLIRGERKTTEKEFKAWFSDPSTIPEEVLEKFPTLSHGLLRTFGALQDPSVLDRLKAKIEQTDPKVILAFGSEPLWMLTGNDSIMDYRGVPLPCTLSPGRKVIATYHPDTIRKQWSLRFVQVHDYRRACRETEFRHILTKERTIHIAETVDDIRSYIDEHCLSADHIAIDVETAKKQITCLCITPSPTSTLEIPIWNELNDDFCEWTREDELEVWLQINRVLTSNIPIVMHNSLYDLSYLEAQGLLTTAPIRDTMLLHHAIQPEVPKSLGFLASLYIPDVGVWKPFGNFSKGNKKTVKSYE